MRPGHAAVAALLVAVLNFAIGDTGAAHTWCAAGLILAFLDRWERV